MDLSALLAADSSRFSLLSSDNVRNTRSSSSGSSQNQEVMSTKPVQNKRAEKFKSRGEKLNARELQQIKDDNRRKTGRLEAQSKRREICLDKENTPVTKSEEATKNPKGGRRIINSRKEKLEEFRKTKKLIEEKKRKDSKPIFRPGGTYKDKNPILPGGKGFMTSEKSSVVPSLSRQASRLNVRNKTPLRNTPTNRNIPISKHGPSGHLAKVKSKPNLGTPGTPKPKLAPKIKPSISDKLKDKKSLATTTPEVIEGKAKTPRRSFAPPNFNFQFHLAPPSTSSKEVDSSVKEQSFNFLSVSSKSSEASSNFVESLNNSSAFDGSGITLGKFKTARPSTLPSLSEDDEVFLKDEDSCPDASSKSNVDVPEIRDCAPSREESIDPISISSQSEDDGVTQRGRRRTRRRSGVQPDLTLSQEVLSLTPAKRAKERSVSKERRRSSCRLCPSDSGDHDHATPRIQRKSTMPVLEEKSPVQEDSSPKFTRRSTRKSINVENCYFNHLNGEEADKPDLALDKGTETVGEENQAEVSKASESFKTPSSVVRSRRCKDLIRSDLKYVTTSRGSSGKRKRNDERLSMSDQSKSPSIVSMFEELESSPLLERLDRKLNSCEKITDADFVEEPVFKSAKLDFEVDDNVQSESQVDMESSESVEEDEKNVGYFRNLLLKETERLSDLGTTWENEISASNNIDEETEGSIRSVVGQARLIMKERFSQFSGLVDNCEFKRGEKETTLTDLTGFWEMIYIQVEDVDKKFALLEKLKSNDWVTPETVKVEKKKKVVKSRSTSAKSKASSGVKEMIAAKRKAMSEKTKDSVEIVAEETEPPKLEEKTETTKETRRATVKEMIAKKRAELANKKKNSSTDDENVKTFDGGFFKLKSPVVTPSISERSSSKKTASRSSGDKLRRSVLTESARRVSGLLLSPYLSKVGKKSDVMSSSSPSPSPQLDSKRKSLFEESVSPRTYSRAISPRAMSSSTDNAFDDLLATTPSNTAPKCVSFTPGVGDPSGAKPPSTPHPKSGRKIPSTPTSSRKVSLMPMADLEDESVTIDPGTPLMSFDSPELSRRRSKRMKTPSI